MKTLLKTMLCFTCLLLTHYSHALPFNVAPNAPLPTQLVGGQAYAFYLVTNNTSSMRNDNYVKYLPPNVTQITTGNVCGSTFSLAPNGQPGDTCVLSLSITGPVNANDPDPHHHLFVCFPGGTSCAGTASPLNVSTPAAGAKTFAYITNVNPPSPGTIVICPIEESTGLLLNPCSVAAQTFAMPADITINASDTLAYIANSEPDEEGTYLCPVDPTIGSLGTCIQSPSAFKHAAPASGPYSVTLSPPTDPYQLLYSGYGNDVIELRDCPVDPTTGMLNNCKVEDTNYNITNITLDATGSLAYLSVSYYSTNGAEIAFCDVVQGQIDTACTDVTDVTITSPNAFTIDPIAPTRVYITNDADEGFNPTVVRCRIISAIMGGLGNCTIEPNLPSLVDPYDIQINASGTMAYITDQGAPGIYTCKVPSTPASPLTDCALFTDPLLTGPYRMALP